MRKNKKICHIAAVAACGLLGAWNAFALSDTITIPAGTNTGTGEAMAYQELTMNESPSAFIALSFDGSNTPYAATVDSAGALTVRQFDGANWTTVGDPGFATNVFRVSLVSCFGGVPMVVYTDDTTGAINAMSFDGTSWNQLGGSPGNHRPNDDPHLGAPSLVCNQMTGNPTLAYIDYINGSNAPNVKEIWGDWAAPIYNGGWDDFSSFSFSPGGDYTLHGLSQGSDFFLTYTEAGTDKPIILNLDNGWIRSEVSGRFSGTGVSTSISQGLDVAYVNRDSIGFANDRTITGYASGGGPYKRVSLASDWNGNSYVLYATGTTSATAYVVKYDGTSITQVGTVGFPLDPTKADSASIMLDASSTPYVSYIDTAQKAVVRKFDGTDWIFINGLLNIPAIPFGSDVHGWDIAGHQRLSANEPASVSVSFVYPYLATVDGSGALTVRQFDGANWTTVGDPGFATNASRVSLALYEASPIVAYTDNTTGEITVQGFNGTSWDQLGGSPGNHRPNNDPHLGSPSLTVDQSANLLYLAYVDYVDDTNFVSTWRLDLAGWSGSNWFTFTDTVMVPGGDYSPRILWEGALYLSYISATGIPTGAYYDGWGSWLPTSDGGLVESGSNMSMTIIDGKINISYAGGGNIGVADIDWWNWMMNGHVIGMDGPYIRSSVTHDLNNFPYLLYVASTASGARAYVAKYDRDIASWTRVGTAPFSLDPTKTDSASISYDSGTDALYAAYVDTAQKAVVRKFNGTDWVVIDNGFDTGHGLALSSAATNGMSMALGPNNIPYVAYRDGNGKATVMKYDGSGWAVVGSAGFSATSVTYLSLALGPNNIPYVAYRDGNGKATVMKYDGSGWAVVGGAGFSAGSVTYVSLAFDSNNIPYVGYKDGSLSPQKATVMKYDGSGWAVVGGAGFSANASNYLSLKIDSANNTPYVAYQDAANGDRATVMTFTGGTWSRVGSGGFSAGTASHVTLAVDSYHTPYVAYQDAANDNKATVMQYTASGWTTIGSAGFGEGSVNEHLSFILDSGHVPYVAYGDLGYGGQARVVKYDGSNWVMVWVPAIGVWYTTYTALALGSDNVLYAAYDDTDIGGKFVVKKTAVAVSAPPPPYVAPSGTVSVSAPSVIAFSAATISNTVQTIDSGVRSFSVQDGKGASAGYYTILSVSDLSDGAWHTIARSNISAHVSGGTVSTLSGTTNASVTVPTGAGTVGAGYVSLGSGATLIQRAGWGGITGTYGVSLALRVAVPAYSPVGTYSGTVTFTLMEN